MSLDFCKKVLFGALVVMAFFSVQLFSEVAIDFPENVLLKVLLEDRFESNKVVEEDVDACCQTLDSKISHVVIPELQSIESKLDQWIGPLTEVVESKVDHPEEFYHVNVIDSCCQTAISKIDAAVITELVSIESKIDALEVPQYPASTACCEQGGVITSGANNITTEGLYTLTGNTTGYINISADRVTINMCGFTLFNDSADAVIEVESAYNNIEVVNGYIEGASGKTNDGILVNAGCRLVNLSDLTILSCDNGVYFAGSSSNLIKSCRIKNCTMYDCNKGALLEYAKKCNFEFCRALNCVKAGFEQNYSDFNMYKKCEVVETANSAANERAIGFESSGGMGNLYMECVADGTQKTSMSNFCNGAIGFLFTGTEGEMEQESKIINCIANSTSLFATDTSATAYGIKLEPVLVDDIFTNSFVEEYGELGIFSEVVYSVDWSSDGKYLAVGGDHLLTTTVDDVYIFHFDGTALKLVTTELHGEEVRTVAWTPDGKYLAVGGKRDGDAIQVFSFDGNTLKFVDSETNAGRIWSVDWSPDGKFLAVGGQSIASPVGGDEIHIFSFDGTTLTFVASKNYGYRAWFVTWSPDGSYLAVVGQTPDSTYEVQVFSFDGATLEPIDSKDYGAAVYSADWSPDGRYLAVGSLGTDDIRIFSFDGTTLELIELVSYGSAAQTVFWSPDGKYLAVGGQNPISPNEEVQIYSFDGTTLELIDSENYGDFTVGLTSLVWSVMWSPDGRYLAAGGQAPSDGNQIKVLGPIMDAPSNCLIEGNKVCNTTGGGFGGIGILGTGDNLYLKNILYANDVHFNDAIVPRFGNIFGPYLGGVPTHNVPSVLDNIFQDG